MVLSCLGGPGPSVLADALEVEREEIEKEEKVQQRKAVFLGTHEGQGWGRSWGLIDGVVFQSPFFPQTPIGHFLQKPLYIADTVDPDCGRVSTPEPPSL